MVLPLAALLPVAGAAIGGITGYQRSGGNLGSALLGAGLGATVPGGFRMAGTALGGVGVRALSKTPLGGLLASQMAKQGGTSLLAKIPAAAGLAAGGLGLLATPALAGSPAAGLAQPLSAGATGTARAAAGLMGYPQGYGQGATYDEAAINAGLTPSGYVDAYGNPLDQLDPRGTAAGRRLEFAKGIEQQRAAMQMLGPEIFKAKEAAARQELQRQLTAAGVRENIATQGAMLRQAQLGAQQVGAQAASQMGSALTQQYQYS
jgi:hypothetical protein